MFAVNGWNVSATKLVQETSKRAAPGTGEEQGSQSKKRKRPLHDDASSNKVQGRELEKLWDRNFNATTDNGNHHDRPSKKQNSAGSKERPIHDRIHARDTVRDRPSKPPRPAVPRDPKEHNSRQREHNSDDRMRKTGLEKRRSKHVDDDATKQDVAAAVLAAAKLPPPPPTTTKLTPLQAKMRAKLTSARFRHLNETLYTTPSSTALTLFASSPELFAEYHAGFSQQVSSSWPRNPVDDFVTSIKTRGPLNNTNNTNPLPRRKTQSCTIADLGCGDAPLARALIPSFTKKLHLTIHSYDLHAPNQHVTVADIAKLPLRDGEADIAIFCLSLMGTNWIDFIEEAWRILRGDGKGEVWVAEVKSRFGRSGSTHTSHRPGEAVNHSVGKRQKPQKGKTDANEDVNEADLPANLFTSEQDDQMSEDTPDLKPFIDVFARRGFQLKPNSIDAKNKMFVSMVFFKSGIPTAGKHKGMKWSGTQYERVGKVDRDDEDKIQEGKVLKPCVYKTR